jgi:DNA repair protein RadA/Sms
MLAILDRHAKLSFSDQEVYVNVVGGLRLTEPATDLPVALALASSLLDRPLGPVAAWGEIGLTGELRAVSHETRRVEEAARLGVPTTVAPHKGTRLGICEALDMALPGWQEQVR